MPSSTEHEIDRIVEALERVSVEAVGVTALALTGFEPELEMTLRQWRALVLIGSRRDGLRVGEVAAHLGGAGPSASRLVRRLEDRGLVETRRDESDRRATRVRLTSAGARLHDTMVMRRRELIRSALVVDPLPSGFSFVDGLDHVAQALASLVGGGTSGRADDD
jgi:DNA-binding MarR family transcriptional regulator